MATKIKAFTIIALTIAVCAAATAAQAENSVPSYTGRFQFVHPVAIWDKGRSVAVMNDKSNPYRIGQEMFVLRGDAIIGLLHATYIGSINTYGSFFSHMRDLRLTVKDTIAAPLPDEMPGRLSSTSRAQVLYHSQDPTGRLWAVIDRGTKSGIEAEQEAAALFNGRAIGTFKVVFAGKNISYGTVDRQAIFPERKTGELIFDFGPKFF